MAQKKRRMGRPKPIVERPLRVQSMLRFKTEEQRELIKRAAYQADTSMNSFIRIAAEKEARAVLGEAG